MKMAYASDCRSRDNADWGRHHKMMVDRRRESIHLLMESLRTSDVSWSVGESIRTIHLSEINTTTDKENQRAGYLQHSEVIPVVTTLGPKPTLVGTLRIRPDYLVRDQFRMLAPSPVSSVLPDSGTIEGSSESSTPEELVMFVRRRIGANTYQWEIEVSLLELVLVSGFEFVNGLYKDDDANWVHIQDGVPYLAGSAGSLVVSCRRCGVEQMMKAKAWFITVGNTHISYCTACNKREALEPVRMDELHNRWLPFWKLVDGPY